MPTVQVWLYFVGGVPSIIFLKKKYSNLLLKNLGNSPTVEIPYKYCLSFILLVCPSEFVHDKLARVWEPISMGLAGSLLYFVLFCKFAYRRPSTFSFLSLLIWRFSRYIQIHHYLLPLLAQSRQCLGLHGSTYNIITYQTRSQYMGKFVTVEQGKQQPWKF